MNIRKRLALLLAAVASLLVYSTASPAQVQPEAKKPETVSVQISEKQQAAALKFWTKQKVAAAKPMQMTSAPLSAQELEKLKQAGTQAVGPQGAKPGGMADPNADAEARAAFPAEWAALEDDLLAATAATDVDPQGTAGVFDSYDLNRLGTLQKLYPHRWVGRLSFSTPAGTSTCSATALNGNTIVTAAHCVYDTTANQFFSNWVFQPAYRNGNAPFGTFAATNCWVLNTWVNQVGGYSISWADDDVAVCEMGLSAGRTLNQRVGFSGYEWNFGAVRHVYNMGYPARDTNDVFLTNPAQYLRTCVAETFEWAADIRGNGCNFGRGISGGPLLRGYQINVAAGFVTGVNSGLFIGQPNLYSGRFTTNNITVLCTAAGC